MTALHVRSMPPALEPALPVQISKAERLPAYLKPPLIRCLNRHHGADTAAITGHWNNITAFVLPANTSLLATAELFAKLQVAFYDSNIQGWFIKFTTLWWRPVTAIRYP